LVVIFTSQFHFEEIFPVATVVALRRRLDVHRLFAGADGIRLESFPRCRAVAADSVVPPVESFLSLEELENLNLNF